MTVTVHRPESLFTMSAFNGLLAIRRYSRDHPDVPLPEVVTALKRVSADDAYHNYDAALALQDIVTSIEPPDADIPAFFRETITILVKQTKPWWLRLCSSGRERVRAAMSLNEAQCLEAAGLFSPAPTAEIRKWWDALAQEVRAREDSRRLEQGRAAEQLTIDYETTRLLALGIVNQPRWISLDDNTAGYDVHSYDVGLVEPIAKLIEVKSSTRQPSEIFLTRNEWETAVERAPNYRFHIWMLPEERLIELTPADIQAHIPADIGDGRWQIIKISLQEPMA
jgi:hypothetical protein